MKTTMPQTSKGASEHNAWIAYMRKCAVEYRAQKATERAQQPADAPVKKQRKARPTEKVQETEHVH